MNLIMIQSCVLVALACLGCAGVNREFLASDTLTFSEREIRSKTWRDSEDRQLQLLDWSVVELKNRGSRLLIAKYGDASSHFIKGLEFYRVIQQGEGLVPYISRSSLDSAMEGAPLYRAVPDAQSFDLLAHDYRPEMVTSVTIEDAHGDVLITIMRETIPSVEKQRQGLRYLLVLDRDYTMHRNSRLELWDIRTQAGNSLGK